MVKEMDNGAELVVASRYVTGGSSEGWGLTRKVISKGATLLAHLFSLRQDVLKTPCQVFCISPGDYKW